ncbi:hypothetical protein KTT_21220 [Tengunoibacter tsumagoiensis]|uniref:Uncharacterized protein n=1 Tax=Tengunoibacter tsumagoiensis TaxID=2014871 RepID=A0A401ZZJ3_9CHLR|nr:hypothetical protein KTT_21220 [Tengunoibacter tsumagoiensis]
MQRFLSRANVCDLNDSRVVEFLYCITYVDVHEKDLPPGIKTLFSAEMCRPDQWLLLVRQLHGVESRAGYSRDRAFCHADKQTYQAIVKNTYSIASKGFKRACSSLWTVLKKDVNGMDFYN